MFVLELQQYLCQKKLRKSMEMKNKEKRNNESKKPRAREREGGRCQFTFAGNIKEAVCKMVGTLRTRWVGLKSFIVFDVLL